MFGHFRDAREDDLPFLRELRFGAEVFRSEDAFRAENTRHVIVVQFGLHFVVEGAAARESK